MPLNYKIFDKQVTSLVAFLQETYSFTTIYSGIYYYVLHITSYYNLKGTSFVISYYLMDVYGTIIRNEKQFLQFPRCKTPAAKQWQDTNFCLRHRGLSQVYGHRSIYKLSVPHSNAILEINHKNFSNSSH